MSNAYQTPNGTRYPGQVMTITLCFLILLNIIVTGWFILYPPAYILWINEFASFEIWTSLSLKANRIFVLAGILATTFAAFLLARFKARLASKSQTAVSWIIDCLAPLGLLPLAIVPLLYADVLAPFWRTNLPIFWVLAILSLTLVKLFSPALDAVETRSTNSHSSDRFWAISILVIATTAYSFGGYYFSSTVGEHVGDEGHYLIQAQSLHEDGDLDIKNQLMTSLNQDDPEKICWGNYHIASQSRGDSWFSWHPYGLSLLLAPFWQWEVAGRQFILGLISGLCLTGLFLVCRRIDVGVTASMLAVLSLGTSLFWTIYSFRALPEVLGGTLLIWTFWAITAQRQHPWLTVWVAAVCCSFMPFAQTRFIPLSLMGIGLYGLYGLMSDQKLYPKLFRLTVFTLLCLAGYGIYMSIQISMFSGGSSYPIRETLFSYPIGAWGAIASDRGIVSIFPTYIWLFSAMIAWLICDKSNRFICLGIIGTFLAGLLTANTYIGYTGGSSLPGRYLVAVTPLLFVGAAIMVERTNKFGRLIFIFLSLFSLMLIALILINLDLVGRSFTLPLHRLHSIPFFQFIYFPHFPIYANSDHSFTLTSIYMVTAITITTLILLSRCTNKLVHGLGIFFMLVLGVFVATNKDYRTMDYYAYFHALSLERARYLELVDPMNTRPPWEASFEVPHFHAFTGMKVDEEQNYAQVMRIAREDVDDPGMMAFGRFRTIFPGSYSASFDLNLSAGRPNIPVARLDVAIDEGRVVLAHVDVGEVPFSGSVHLPFNALKFLNVEPRIYYHGTGDMDFRGLMIREQAPDNSELLPALAFERVPMEIVRVIFPYYLKSFHSVAPDAPDTDNRNGDDH